MHPFLAIYDLQPVKTHPLVFAPGVPVTAQVVGTERYTSGSKVAGRARGSWAEGGLRPSEWTTTQCLPPLGGDLHPVFCPLDAWRLYLDDQEEVPSFPGAASGPPETQSLDEPAPSGTVRGPVCFLSRAGAPAPAPITAFCLSPSPRPPAHTFSCPSYFPAPALPAAPPPLTPVTRKPSQPSSPCPWFCANSSAGLDAQNALGSLPPFLVSVPRIGGLLPASRPPPGSLL